MIGSCGRYYFINFSSFQIEVIFRDEFLATDSTAELHTTIEEERGILDRLGMRIRAITFNFLELCEINIGKVFLCNEFLYIVQFIESSPERRAESIVIGNEGSEEWFFFFKDIDVLNGVE